MLSPGETIGFEIVQSSQHLYYVSSGAEIAARDGQSACPKNRVHAKVSANVFILLFSFAKLADYEHRVVGSLL